ncbi:MAG: hypothetical protein HUK26_09805, partial [Duodenibacillus sp.]|nr:hypothetical protein [Duodenibacillus sp.]
EQELLSFVAYSLSQAGLGASFEQSLSRLSCMNTNIDGEGAFLSASQLDSTTDLTITRDSKGDPAQAHIHYTVDKEFYATKFMGQTLAGPDGEGVLVGDGRFELEMTIDLKQPFNESGKPNVTLSLNAGALKSTTPNIDGKFFLPSALTDYWPAEELKQRTGEHSFNSFMTGMAEIARDRPVEFDIAMKTPANLPEAADMLFTMGVKVKDAVADLNVDDRYQAKALRLGFEAVLRNVPGLAMKLENDSAMRGELARLVGAKFARDINGIASQEFSTAVQMYMAPQKERMQIVY